MISDLRPLPGVYSGIPGNLGLLISDLSPLSSFLFPISCLLRLDLPKGHISKLLDKISHLGYICHMLNLTGRYINENPNYYKG